MLNMRKVQISSQSLQPKKGLRLELGQVGALKLRGAGIEGFLLHLREKTVEDP